MELTLNGQSRQVAGRTVADLVHELGLTGQALAVEVNRQVVPRRDHDKTPLHTGDNVEVVTLVGGG